MRQHTITLYKFSELSEKAQRRAWESGPDFSGDHSSEYRATLSAFENAFDIKVYRYNVNDYKYDFAFVAAGAATGAPDGDALRLARYIWNNYADQVTRGKYYSTPGEWIDGKYSYKYRHSKATFEMDNCPLTGFCADMDILQPVIDCLHYKQFFDCFDDLMNECLDNFFRAWQSEIEYCASFEYFAEMCDINDWEFTETGEIW